MGPNNSLEITYDEWRSFFLSNPVVLESVTNDPHEMLRYWRAATVSHWLCCLHDKLFFIVRSISIWVIHRMLHLKMKKLKINNGGKICWPVVVPVLYLVQQRHR